MTDQPLILQRKVGRTQRLLCGTLATALLLTSFPAAPAWAQSHDAFSVEFPPISLSNLATLDVSRLRIPETLGHVVEAWQPSNQVPNGLIVHLQDLHVQESAQTRLSELIGYLHERFGLQLVALEGADGPVDTTIFSDFPDPKINDKLAKVFLKHGLFTGSEYYAVTHPGNVTLWGAEDEATYLEHVKVITQAYQHTRSI